MLLLVVYFYYNYILNSCSGQFIYSLDDSYIHLSLAKNFVDNGNIGINSEEFGLATSSPLWTAILILIFKIFGYNELVPFYLNILIAVLIIIYAYRIIQRYYDNLTLSITLLLLVIISIPIIPMIFIGMEHLLHLLLSCIFIESIIKLKTNSQKKITNFLILAVLTSLLSLVRYEAIFLIIASFIIFYKSKHRFQYWITIAFFTTIPHIIIGLYSISQGGFFLPNPIILKGFEETPSIITFIHRYVYSGVINLVENTHLFVSVISSFTFLIFFYLQRQYGDYQLRAITGDSKNKQYFYFNQNVNQVKDTITIFIITTFLHLQFAKTGWFYRYEAYLVGVFIIFLLPLFIKLVLEYSKNSELIIIPKGRLYLIIFLFLIIIPFIHRGIESHNRLRFAPINIYEQQYQISKFLDSYFPDQPVGMNDIGLSSLKSKAKVIDIYGLADNHIARAKYSGFYSPEYFYDYLNKKNCTILIIFESWFENEIKYYNELIRVATLKIQNNEVCGMDEVSFYAINLTSAEKLKTSLEKYKEILPKTVNLRILI
mgnify:CR=1 FL=1